MRTIYVDAERKCHVTDDGTMKAVETTAFDGKCDAFVEGFCYDDTRGFVSVYPWNDYDELDAAQHQYERQLLAEYQATISDMDTALTILLGGDTP